MENEIKVSVICLAYNHAKYIRECLDGFVMQKTNFKYEVIIHDDASTDNTAEIIKEYELKYPEIIKPIYQTENQHSKGVRFVSKWMLPKAQGKFIAFCEGDDFWCDENKLQIQFDIMESNLDCKMCIHRVGSCRENGELFNVFKPNFDLEDGKMSSRRYIETGVHYQLSGLMLDGEAYKEYQHNPPEFKKVIKCVGDVPLMLYFGQLAPVYYTNKIMSIHRSASIGSWSERQNKNKDGAVAEFFEQQVHMLIKFNEYTCYKYNDLLDYRIEDMKVKVLLERGDKRELKKKENKKALQNWWKRASDKKNAFNAWLKCFHPKIHATILKIKGK